jgi:hypothetical protein
MDCRKSFHNQLMQRAKIYFNQRAMITVGLAVLSHRQKISDAESSTSQTQASKIILHVPREPVISTAKKIDT